MAQQTINIGASPNDGTGTPLRTAFQYTNSNFSELYTALGGGSGLPGSSGQVIFNDGGTNLAGDTGLTFNKTTDTLGTGRLTTSGDAIVCSSTGDFYVGTTISPQFKVERATGSATITGDLTVDTSTLKVDSANNRVGVLTASPAAALHVNNGNIRLNDGYQLEFGGGLNSISGSNASNYLLFYINNSEAMRLNSTGLGVGTSNFAYKLNAAGFIAAVDPSFTGTGGSLIGAMLNNDNTAPGLDLRRWTGTAGTHGTTYIATDATGATFFYNGQQASNTKATSLKMTLDADGNLLVGVTSALFNSRLRVKTSSTSASDYGVYVADSADALIFALRNDGLIYTGTKTASPYNNTTGSAANAFIAADGTLGRSTSSLKYKTDITDSTRGLADVLKLRPVTYKSKNGDDTIFGGLIAEEVHAAGLTEFVAYAPDNAPDAIHYSNMVSLLVAAIKELTARVQTLETR